jgi:hypothetical protein
MKLRIGGAIGAACLLAIGACDRTPDLRAQCEAMSSEHLPGVTVSAAAAITDREELPGFCQIQGTIDPSIGFEARFPLADWNGKYSRRTAAIRPPSAILPGPKTIRKLSSCTVTAPFY